MPHPLSANPQGFAPRYDLYREGTFNSIRHLTVPGVTAVALISVGCAGEAIARDAGRRSHARPGDRLAREPSRTLEGERVAAFVNEDQAP